MKLDFSTKLTDLKGDVIKEGEADFTFGGAAAHVLLMRFADEANLSADESVSRFKLAVKVTAGGVQDLSIEEVAQIKKLIARAYTPLIVGRVYELIEGNGVAT